MPQQNELILKNKVKQARTLKEITQEDLADRVEVTRQTIIAIEKGDYVPSTFLALRLALALEVDVNTLFYLSDKTNEQS